jgi:hypothetical protein
MEQEKRRPLKELTREQRLQRLEQRQADAQVAIQEHEAARRAFYANKDRLKALRVAREAQADQE